VLQARERFSAPVVERHKRPGVCYALTEDGIELPVIDLTNPAFGDLPDQAAQEQKVRGYLQTMARQSRIPGPLMHAMVWLMSRRSILVRAIHDSGGTYLSGLATYMLKLGPENLGAGYATRLDRVVAGSVPALSTRLRLRNVAHLAAEALAPRLRVGPGQPLRLLNIAGGPAADSINALLLLHREHPELLESRPVHVHVLDVDPAGATFGARALEALRSAGGPLQGVDATLEHHRYDWRESRALHPLTDGWDLEHAIVAGSSEGGLFEYGDDEIVMANLESVRRLAPAGQFMVGSVTRDGPLTRAAHASGLPQATHLRSLEGFTALVTRAGWTVDRVIDNLMSFDVRLRPATRPA
jgi:hypothetical protein